MKINLTKLLFKSRDVVRPVGTTGDWGTADKDEDRTSGDRAYAFKLDEPSAKGDRA